ncbi:MAG: DNA/RNA nuclease SfsA [Candidatus Neomarinimicrobiota bacterium]
MAVETVFPSARQVGTVMPVPWRLRRATFVDRPNRFLTHIRLAGELLEAHLPDPGRLVELLLPGVDVLVQFHPEAIAKGATRRTAYTVHMVRRPGGEGWVCVNTLLPNRFVAFLLGEQRQPSPDGWSLARREVTEGDSRFDFLLRNGQQSMFLEVKSVTYAEGGVAQFPDAVSARGARHARHLAQLTRAGQQAMILFVIQRDDVELFRPMWARDPELGHALVEAHEAGVVIRAIKLAVTPDRFTFAGDVPVDLEQPKA